MTGLNADQIDTIIHALEQQVKFEETLVEIYEGAIEKKQVDEAGMNELRKQLLRQGSRLAHLGGTLAVVNEMRESVHD